MKFNAKLKCHNADKYLVELYFGGKDTVDIQAIKSTPLIFVAQAKEALKPFELEIENGECFEIVRVRIGKNDQLSTTGVLSGSIGFVVNWDVIRYEELVMIHVVRIK